MAIYSGFSHEKWWFSIVMLVYQGYQRAVENDQCVVGFGYWYAFCCYCWRTRMWRECKKTDILQQYWGSNLNPSGWIEIIHQPDKFGYSSRVFPHPNHHLRSFRMKSLFVRSLQFIQTICHQTSHCVPQLMKKIAAQLMVIDHFITMT